MKIPLWVLLAVLGIGVVAVVFLTCENAALQVERNKALANAATYILQAEDAQGRYLAAVNSISSLEVDNATARAKIDELSQRITTLVRINAELKETVSVVSGEGTVVEVPGITGEWSASTDRVDVLFDLNTDREPQGEFTITAKALALSLGLALTDDNAVYVYSNTPDVVITSVEGEYIMDDPAIWMITAGVLGPNWGVTAGVNRRIFNWFWVGGGLTITDNFDTVGGVLNVGITF